MKRRVIGIAAAIVLAMFGTIVLVAYVQSAKTNATASERLVPVLLVAKPIAKGTAASAITGSVKTTQVPANLKATSSVTDLGALKGLVAGTDLVAGEQLLATRFVQPEMLSQGASPSDKLRVTVSLDPQRVLGAQIHAGDTVAVVISLPKGSVDVDETHMVLHQILVTDVQGGTPAAAPSPSKSATASTAPTSAVLVTLAMDAPSVERVVFAAEFGKLWLAAEPPNAPQGGTKIVTGGNVYQ
jgi:pilus assembly protein CpaB